MGELLRAEEVAEAMYEMVKASQGRRNLKPMDLTKSMIERFGAERCDKVLCKQALRLLIDPGRCVYSYFGGSYVTLPSEDGTPG